MARRTVCGRTYLCAHERVPCQIRAPVAAMTIAEDTRRTDHSRWATRFPALVTTAERRDSSHVTALAISDVHYLDYGPGPAHAHVRRLRARHAAGDGRDQAAEHRAHDGPRQPRLMAGACRDAAP